MLFFSMALVITPALPAMAQSSITTGRDTGLEATANEAGLSTGASQFPLETLIGSLIETLLSFVGILFLILTVYAGILWMTASGEDAKVLKAKKLLSSAIIGLIIITAAYAFTAFVIGALSSSPKAASSPCPPGDSCGG